MALNVSQELAVMKQMTADELRAKYAEVFGEPARTKHKQWLIKRIIWRMQSLEQGDLSERARRRARELANDAELRITAPRTIPLPPASDVRSIRTVTPFTTDDRLPMAGAILAREYQGRSIRVLVLPKGFEFEGEVYRSLSAVAKAVTGAHWNGYHFFGLKLKEVAS